MKRQTIQRRLVLEAVCNRCHHATADEVYAFVSLSAPDISRATVYRNLNNLVFEGLLQKISVPGEADRFDHNCTNHYHIRCEKCGNVEDIDMDYIPDLPANVRDAHGFKILGFGIFFTGLCPACQNRK